MAGGNTAIGIEIGSETTGCRPTSTRGRAGWSGRRRRPPNRAGHGTEIRGSPPVPTWRRGHRALAAREAPRRINRGCHAGRGGGGTDFGRPPELGAGGAAERDGGRGTGARRGAESGCRPTAVRAGVWGAAPAAPPRLTVPRDRRPFPIRSPARALLTLAALWSCARRGVLDARLLGSTSSPRLGRQSITALQAFPANREVDSGPTVGPTVRADPIRGQPPSGALPSLLRASTRSRPGPSRGHPPYREVPSRPAASARRPHRRRGSPSE